jgi:hypothetical protein
MLDGLDHPAVFLDHGDLAVLMYWPAEPAASTGSARLRGVAQHGLVDAARSLTGIDTEGTV